MRSSTTSRRSDGPRRRRSFAWRRRGAALLRTLAGKGLLRSFEQERREERPPSRLAADSAAFVPTPAQAVALEAITSAIRERRVLPGPSSGRDRQRKDRGLSAGDRTALEAGRGAIWLVPEIALTPVFARELAARVSGPRRGAPLRPLGARARRGLGPVALGDRRDRPGLGGVRAGRWDPGLFIVDEEHNASYKQRESPGTTPGRSWRCAEGERGRPRLRLGDALGGSLPRGRRRARSAG